MSSYKPGGPTKSNFAPPQAAFKTPVAGRMFTRPMAGGTPAAGDDSASLNLPAMQTPGKLKLGLLAEHRLTRETNRAFAETLTNLMITRFRAIEELQFHNLQNRLSEEKERSGGAHSDTMNVIRAAAAEKGAAFQRDMSGLLDRECEALDEQFETARRNLEARRQAGRLSDERFAEEVERQLRWRRLLLDNLEGLISLQLEKSAAEFQAYLKTFER